VSRNPGRAGRLDLRLAGWLDLRRAGRLHRFQEGWLPVRMARMFLLPNELRRSSDRIEAAILAGLAAAFVTAAVVAALLVASLCHSALAAAAAGPRPTDAVLTSPGTIPGKFFPQQATARATWRLSDGTERSGILNANIAPGIYGEPAGATVQVWLNRAGDLEPPPQSPDGMLIGAALAGLTIIGCAAAVLAYSYRLCRRVLDGRRLARWSSAWAVTGPRWMRHQ
jgi:hypothetical protein